MKDWKKSLAMLTLCLLLVILSACGEGESNGDRGTEGATNAEKETQSSDENLNEEAVQEPVKVTAYSYWREFSDDYWNEVLIEPVRKKYPYIELEVIKPVDGNGTNHLKELIVANEAPDLVISDIGDC